MSVLRHLIGTQCNRLTFLKEYWPIATVGALGVRLVSDVPAQFGRLG